MSQQGLNPGLPLLQQADLRDKVVLVRVDHNVVKKGVIKDPYRIDRTIGTLYYIVAQGGKPILMTHVGRPRDKKDRRDQGGSGKRCGAHCGLYRVQAAQPVLCA